MNHLFWNDRLHCMAVVSVFSGLHFLFYVGFVFVVSIFFVPRLRVHVRGWTRTPTVS